MRRGASVNRDEIGYGALFCVRCFEASVQGQTLYMHGGAWPVGV